MKGAFTILFISIKDMAPNTNDQKLLLWQQELGTSLTVYHIERPDLTSPTLDTVLILPEPQ